jgi:putative MATE family efflux protein
MTKSARLTSGPVGQMMARLTLQMMVGILAMVAFNLVDTYFIGQLGTTELAAISFTFPVVMIVGSLAAGLGVGASAVISRAIGEGDTGKVRRLTTDALMLAFLAVAVLSSVGLLTIDPLFTLLGATPEVLPLIREYITLWYVAMMVVVTPMIGNHCIRATGDMKTPAFIMLFAVVLNAILDPALIFGIGDFAGFGIAGASLATVISRAFTLVASLLILHYREHMLTFVRPRLTEVWQSWRQILYVGIPAAGTQMLIPLSLGVITGMVAVYGPTAVAAFGVASRIETFGLAVIQALATTLTPFVGQNWGAGHHDRVQRAANLSQQFALGWGVALFVLLAGLREPIATIFTDNPAVIATLSSYLVIVSLSYGLFGLLLVVNATLNALNRPLQSTVLMALRMVGLYVPLAILGSAWFGINGIFAAAFVANIGAGVAAAFWLRRVFGFAITTHAPQKAIAN